MSHPASTPMYPGIPPGVSTMTMQPGMAYSMNGASAPHPAAPSFHHLGYPQQAPQPMSAEENPHVENSSEHSCSKDASAKTSSHEQPEITNAAASSQAYAENQAAMGPDAYKHLGFPQYQYQYQPNSYATSQAQPAYGPAQGFFMGTPTAAPQPHMPFTPPQGAPQAPFPPHSACHTAAPGSAPIDPHMYQYYASQQAMPGFDAGSMDPRMAQHFNTQQPGAAEQQYQDNPYGQHLLEMCSDLMQGKTDPTKIANFLTSTGTHFWKGALIGAGITFLATNSGVRSAISDTLKSIFGGKDSTKA